MADRKLELEMLRAFLNSKGLLAVDDSIRNISEPFTLIGNQDSSLLIHKGEKIWLKGITIQPVIGTTGIIRLRRSSDDKVILPLAIEKKGASGVSSSFNMPIEAGDSVYVDIVDANISDENFIGISYLPDNVYEWYENDVLGDSEGFLIVTNDNERIGI